MHIEFHENQSTFLPIGLYSNLCIKLVDGEETRTVGNLYVGFSNSTLTYQVSIPSHDSQERKFHGLPDAMDYARRQILRHAR